MEEKSIKFEFTQIEAEIEIIQILKAILKNTELDKIQIRAAASSLHSIYNGIEKILFLKLKERNIKLSTEGRWHAELLEIATSEGIITTEINTKLKNYLGFRHFYRHNYGYMLDIELLKPLISNIEELILDIKKIII